MTCCVTGHRPQGFPFERDASNHSFAVYMFELKQKIEYLIKSGCTQFITGMAEGADLDFAEAVLELKDNYPNITLTAALPYPLSSRVKQDRKSEILKAVDTMREVSDHYFKGCMQKRNRYMVDNSDILIAVWNGEERGGTWDTIKYARRQNKKIIYIMLYENMIL